MNVIRKITTNKSISALGTWLLTDEGKQYASATPAEQRAAFIEAIKGKAGDAGAPGPAGPAGKDGKDGATVWAVIKSSDYVDPDAFISGNVSQFKDGDVVVIHNSN